jgi:peptide deformylase
MAILKVARMGHPVLRAPARAIDVGEVKSSRIQQLIDDMFETMNEYQGVGLAAPQVHEGVRLFVAGFPPASSRRSGPGRSYQPREDEDERADDRIPLMTLINPEITIVGEETVEDWEGCLSIPDIRGQVPRARQVVVRALDRRGKRIELPASDFTARVIQHETDHLNGILFFDRMTSFQSLTFLEEFSRYWSGQEVKAE